MASAGCAKSVLQCATASSTRRQTGASRRRSSGRPNIASHTGAPLDNNPCERALKKASLHRKNALFYCTLNGAKVCSLVMCLICTAERHRVEPFDYLVTQLRHAAALDLDPAAWMPCHDVATPGAPRR